MVSNDIPKREAFDDTKKLLLLMLLLLQSVK